MESTNQSIVEIQWDRAGRAFWHTNCTNHLGGVMKEVKREPDKSVFECLHCGKRGEYPVGGVGTVCSPELSATPAHQEKEKS